MRRIQDAAKAPTAPRELRELQKRVDSGELTWRDIVDGRHLEDPGVRAAMSASMGRLRRIYSKFKEGYDLDEVLDSERPPGRGA